MVEEKPGVEIVEQVHAKAQAALLHDQKLSALVEAAVFRAALGTVARLHRNAIARHVPDGVPTIVAGDVNDKPGSATWQALSSRRTDAFAAAGTGSPFTSTAASPHQTIDGIFVDPRITVRAAHVVTHPDAARASDHLPVLAELELPES